MNEWDGCLNKGTHSLMSFARGNSTSQLAALTFCSIVCPGPAPTSEIPRVLLLMLITWAAVRVAVPAAIWMTSPGTAPAIALVMAA